MQKIWTVLGTGNSEAKIKQLKILQKFWPVFSIEGSDAEVKQLKICRNFGQFSIKKIQKQKFNN
jgi:hypothetical protein